MTNIWKLFKIVSNCWKNCLELFWNCLTIVWKLFRIVSNCFKIVSKCSTKNQQTIAKPFLRKWFVEILQLIDIILKTDQFSPQMVCRDFATCICKKTYIWIQLQKTDQFSPQMVCRDFCCKCVVSNYCQTIVKLFYSNSRIFKLLSKQLFKLLNYCQNNFVNNCTIAKTISQTIDDTLKGPLVTLHQKPFWKHTTHKTIRPEWQKSILQPMTTKSSTIHAIVLLEIWVPSSPNLSPPFFHVFATGPRNFANLQQQAHISIVHHGIFPVDEILTPKSHGSHRAT